MSTKRCGSPGSCTIRRFQCRRAQVSTPIEIAGKYVIFQLVDRTDVDMAKFDSEKVPDRAGTDRAEARPVLLQLMSRTWSRRWRRTTRSSSTKHCWTRGSANELEYMYRSARQDRATEHLGGAVAQLEEYLNGIQGVGSSNLLSSTNPTNNLEFDSLPDYPLRKPQGAMAFESRR